MPLAQFKIFSPDEFETYLHSSVFSRPIRVIQNHHTWRPGYTHLTTQRGEMYWLESMRSVHINDRKWSDIGQHITTFPSGNIALCRPIDLVPAGIGFSQKLFEIHDELIQRALELVSECECEDGCPSCVGPGGENGVGGKQETLEILKELTPSH